MYLDLFNPNPTLLPSLRYRNFWIVLIFNIQSYFWGLIKQIRYSIQLDLKCQIWDIPTHNKKPHHQFHNKKIGKGTFVFFSLLISMLLPFMSKVKDEAKTHLCNIA